MRRACASHRAGGRVVPFQAPSQAPHPTPFHTHHQPASHGAASLHHHHQALVQFDEPEPPTNPATAAVTADSALLHLQHFSSAPEGLFTLASRTSLPTCLDPAESAQDPAYRSLLSSQGNLATSREPSATPEAKPRHYVTSGGGGGAGNMRKAADDQRGSKHVRFWTSTMGQVLRRIRDRKKRKSGAYNSSFSSDTGDHDLDDLEMQVVRYKPEGLDALCRNTKFSRKELQIMYRGFKQECPSGIVNEETFKDIYAQFFPQGDSSAYAHYVFNTFDQDRNGTISFEEFVMGLSVLARGSLHEKLQWAFSLYDINGDGIITKDEMLDIVSAIYDMMGRFAEPSIDEHTAKDHVERVFQRMDVNKDGVISVEEFMDTCRKDKNIEQSMMVFDTAT